MYTDAFFIHFILYFKFFQLFNISEFQNIYIDLCCRATLYTCTIIERETIAYNKDTHKNQLTNIIILSTC